MAKLLFRIQNRSGFSFAIVLIVLLVVSILGLTIVNASVSNFKLTIIERDSQSAYYVAEAGLNHRVHQIHTLLANLDYPITNTTLNNFFETVLQQNFANPVVINSFEDNFGRNPTSTITVAGSWDGSSTEATYTISSVGNIGNRSRRVEANVRIVADWVGTPPGEPFNISNDMALFTNSNITLSNGTINGPVGTNLSTNGSINISGGNPTINGSVQVGPSANLPNVYNKLSWQNPPSPTHLDEVRTFTMPVFPATPSFTSHPNVRIGTGSNAHDVILNNDIRITHSLANGYELVMNNDLSVNNVTFNSNRVLIINVGDADRSLTVNNLNMTNGHILLKGTGKLTIYANSITLGSGSSMNNPAGTVNNPTQSPSSSAAAAAVGRLQVYLAEKTPAETFTMTGSQKIYGSLYAKNANIRIDNGAGFMGHIVTGGNSVILDGGTHTITRLLYAPNAHVQMLSGARLTGSIIANTFLMNGGANLTHSQTPSGQLPFFPIDETGVAVGGQITSSNVTVTAIREN